MQLCIRLGIILSILVQVIIPFTQILSDAVPSVTVYVHGTMSSPALKLVYKAWPDLSFGAPGLHHFNTLPEHAFLRTDALCLQQGAPDRFNVEHFYTFKWSGKLSFEAREQAGKDLFFSLKILLDEYKSTYGIYPKLRIMTFSHGGNVALNMVQYLPFLANEHVDLELLMIACPVQKITEKLVEHDEVDRVYMISSSNDLMQVLDFYTYENKRCFPSRFFEKHKQNCLQVKVTVNGRAIGHYDLFRSFIRHIPLTMNALDSWAACRRGDSINPIMDYDIYDEKFRFFNGINLFSVVSGCRKQ